jgi:hypothetical protein
VVGGDENKIHTLTPDSCKCKGEKQELDEKTGQPAADAAALRKNMEESRKLVSAAAGLAASVRRGNPVGAATSAKELYNILLAP